MSKSFRKASPIKYRQLLSTIEKIVSINNEDEDNPVLNDIYRIVHPFVGQCDNRHEDWREFADETAEKLKDY
mgnify:CR=1 FL=1